VKKKLLLPSSECYTTDSAYVTPKVWLIYTKLHGVITQKYVIPNLVGTKILNIFLNAPLDAVQKQ